MVAIGVWMYRRTNTTTDYFLGGAQFKQLGHRSECTGVRHERLAAARFAGINLYDWRERDVDGHRFGGRDVFNWQFIAKRLRRYTEVNQSITSDYLDNRFKDQSKALRIVSALTILVFFLFLYRFGYGRQCGVVSGNIPYRLQRCPIHRSRRRCQLHLSRRLSRCHARAGARSRAPAVHAARLGRAACS